MTSTARQRVAAALSVQNRQRVAAEAARKIIADASARNGQQPAAVTVDGRAGAPLESVNPDHGRIEVRYTLLADVLAWVHAQLVLHSPVASGAYAASHVWLADGQPCDGDPPPGAKVYTALSTAPYARKIERGESSMAPDGVYEAVAALAQRRFGNVAHINFEFRSPVSAYVAGGANRDERAAQRGQPGRRAAIRQERATRVPAIVVTPR